MLESLHTRVLAVDGGGTRCRIAVGDGDGMTVVETGSANVSTDIQGSLRQIFAGFEALSARTGEDLLELSRLPAFVGLAGVTGPEIVNVLREALPFKCLRIEDDRPAALRGALNNRDGVVAHCGTGSFFGAQLEGVMRFSGGWGPAVGDEASAQWVGRQALALTLEAVDGRAAKTLLAKKLLEKFGGAAGIVRFAGAATPPEFGNLAPLVTSAAQAKDALGVRVMKVGAAEIARSLRSIGWKPGLAVCLTGGIGPHFEPYLPREMCADMIAPAGEPLTGAMSLAMDLAKEIAK